MCSGLKKRERGLLNNRGPVFAPIKYDSMGPATADGMRSRFSVNKSSLPEAAYTPAVTSKESPGKKKTIAPVSTKMISVKTGYPSSARYAGSRMKWISCCNNSIRAGTLARGVAHRTLVAGRLDSPSRVLSKSGVRASDTATDLSSDARDVEAACSDLDAELPDAYALALAD